MKRVNKYRPGQHKVVCDRSGMRVYSSDTVVEWNGLRVCKHISEARHPQDFVKGRKDDMRAPDSRPPGVDHFLADGEVTADDL